MNNRTAKMLRRLSKRTGVKYRHLKKEWVRLPDEIKFKIRQTQV